MNRKTEYDTAKITSVATKKSILTGYVDLFEKEKLHLKAFDFTTKDNIDFYLDFQEVFRLCSDLENGAMAKTFKDGNSYSLGYKGSAKSSKYNGKPESRSGNITFSNGKVFINFTSGEGRLTETGAILPDGNPQLKIGVSMDCQKMKEFFLYSRAMIQSYLTLMVNNMLKNYDEQLKKLNAAKETEIK